MHKDNFSSQLISLEESIKHFKCSSNSTLYHNPEFINYVLDDVIWIGGFKKNSLLCTMPLFKKSFPDFFYYSGPLWKDTFTEMKSYRRFSTSQKIYKKMIMHALDIKTNLFFQFPSTNFDIRAFDWWNYGASQEIRFKTSIRYTAKIADLQFQTKEDIKLNLRSDDKRKSLSKMLREESKYLIEDDISVDEFINLYKQTLSRSNAEIPNTSLNILENLFSYVRDKNSGATVTLKNSNTKEVIGSQLMIYHDNVANAIAQGINQQFFNSNIVSYLIYNSLLRAKKDGIRIFDFNGANSPTRADDKHAYGAHEVPFYCLEY